MAKLDDELARINRKLYQEYKEYGIPAEDRLFEQMDMDTTAASMKDAVSARRKLGQVDDRNQARYGATRNSAQVGNESRRNSLSGAMSEGDAGNNAIIQDQDRELSQIQTLMNQGASLRNAAQNGLGSAAANETARNNAYSAAKQNYQQKQASTFGSLAGMAAMAFI